MKEESLADISSAMIERYSARYREMGYHIRTLGWGTVEQQRYRFAQTLDLVDPAGKLVLDIGCGFGDYADFLLEASIAPGSYLGVDINPDLIGEAASRNQDRPDREFRVLDLARAGEEPEPLADVGVMLGLLNLNLSGKMDNYEYSQMMIAKALGLVREALVVDFISARRDPSYPKEDFIFYHEPGRMLEFGLSLAADAAVKHDYLPIPQKEFMLVIRKEAA